MVSYKLCFSCFLSFRCRQKVNVNFDPVVPVRRDPRLHGDDVFWKGLCKENHPTTTRHPRGLFVGDPAFRQGIRKKITVNNKHASAARPCSINNAIPWIPACAGMTAFAEMTGSKTFAKAIILYVTARRPIST